jgi:hypothetical protein
MPTVDGGRARMRLAIGDAKHLLCSGHSASIREADVGCETPVYPTFRTQISPSGVDRRLADTP